MSRKSIRNIVLLAGILFIGVIVLSVLTRGQRNRIMVQTAKVTRHDLTSIVTASGEIRPKRYVNVSSDVPGRITKLLVKEGDQVSAGQPLCQIDATRLAASTRQTAAGLDGARADLKRNEADLVASRIAFERARKMLADKLISDQDFERTEADFKMKTAQVESQKQRITQAEALLASDQDSLHKTTVAAPMAGVVTALLKEEGETVIGAQSFQPTVIMTVADLSIMEAEVMVDETDIQSLKLGQPAEVRVDALPDAKIKGDVTEIGASAIVRGASAASTQIAAGGNQAKDFKVTVTLSDPPKGLRPGLNAATDITAARREHVLAVPIQAVVVRALNKEGKVINPSTGPGPAGGDNPAPTEARAKNEEKEGVFVLNGGQAQFRAVKTGILGETDIEILEGLKEGDTIVSGSYRTLRTLNDNARVRVESTDAKKAAR